MVKPKFHSWLLTTRIVSVTYAERNGFQNHVPQSNKKQPENPKRNISGAEKLMLAQHLVQ